MTLLEQATMTRDEYLVWAEKQPGRWEFVGGEVYAMTGARRVHNVVALNLAAALHQALQGTPCVPYTSDMRLAILESGADFYPDIMVSCDPRDAQADLALSHPRLLAEVLSDSTAAYDRGTKFAHYRRIPELQEMLFIDADLRTLELFRRAEPEGWLLTDESAAEHITLCGATLAVAELFAGLPPKTAALPPAP